jgi:hypothetical protein
MPELGPSLPETLLYTDVVEIFRDNAGAVGIALGSETADRKKETLMVLVGRVVSRDLVNIKPVVTLMRGQHPIDKEEDRFILLLKPVLAQDELLIDISHSETVHIAPNTPRLSEEEIKIIRDMLKETEWDAKFSADVVYELIQREINMWVRNCEAELETLTDSKHFVSKYLDRLDASVRPELIALYRQEIEALGSLDVTTTITGEVEEVHMRFHKQREALKPNKNRKDQLS